jgi:hypothetical protein
MEGPVQPGPPCFGGISYLRSEGRSRAGGPERWLVPHVPTAFRRGRGSAGTRERADLVTAEALRAKLRFGDAGGPQCPDDTLDHGGRPAIK